MLIIDVEDTEFFNEEDETFSIVSGPTVMLEHSLISLSKWESKHNIPFLSSEKTSEQTFDYIKLMIVNDVDPECVVYFTKEQIDQIQNYIESAQSATTFNQMPERSGPKEVVTAELIYYWMVGFNIPFECETWHLNKLFSLIRICNIKQSKQKKMPKGEIAQRNRDLNAQRKAMLGTSG